MAAKTGKINESFQKLGLSGLQGTKRLRARRYVKKAALEGLKRKGRMEYTWSPRRWDGIDHKRNGLKGEAPLSADCSAFATWCLWTVLVHHFGLTKDIVNGQSWKEGYTGTLTNHGRKIENRRNWRRGDLILYGDPYGPSGHVAVYIGLGMVVSFGGQGGPYLLKWDYRSDYHSTRRYI